jgi:hypothetical protein
MDVSVQVPRRLHSLDDGVERSDALVWFVVAVTESEGWRVGQQYVDRAASTRPTE